MNMFRPNKHRIWLRLITFTVITVMVWQGVMWASASREIGVVPIDDIDEDTLASKSWCHDPRGRELVNRGGKGCPRRYSRCC